MGSRQTRKLDLSTSLFFGINLHMQTSSTDFPALSVYEVIDLGLVSNLKLKTQRLIKDSDLELLQTNHPVLHADSIYDDTIYVYHTFGVHVLNLNPILANLASALKEDDEKKLDATLQNPSYTSVQAILSTYPGGHE